MKTKTTLILMIAAMLLIGTSCEKSVMPVRGNGDVVTETREFPSFDRVANEGEFEIFIVQDEEYSVTIEAESNLIGRIRTNMNGNTLEVESRDNLRPSRPMRLIIHTPHMNGISLSGSGLIDLGHIVTGTLDVSLSGSGIIRGEVEAEEVFLSMSGSGNSRIALECNYLETKISGSGEMFFNGNAHTASFNISGAGAIKAYDLYLSECRTKVSGSGDMYINVSDMLDVIISGSGSVYYLGYPEIHTNISGSGQLVSMN